MICQICGKELSGQQSYLFARLERLAVIDSSLKVKRKTYDLESVCSQCSMMISVIIESLMDI